MLLETFNTLLHDPAHWEFELLVGLVEMVVFDLLIGVLVWPRIKRHIHKDISGTEGEPLENITAIEQRLHELECDVNTLNPHMGTPQARHDTIHTLPVCSYMHH